MRPAVRWRRPYRKLYPSYIDVPRRGRLDGVASTGSPSPVSRAGTGRIKGRAPRARQREACHAPGAPWRLPTFEFVEFRQCLGPILPEQSGQRPIGQQFAARLAMSAVVGLIVGIANSLNALAASRTGLTEAPVHRHFGAKRRDLFRKF